MKKYVKLIATILSVCISLVNSHAPIFHTGSAVDYEAARSTNTAKYERDEKAMPSVEASASSRTGGAQEDQTDADTAVSTSVSAEDPTPTPTPVPSSVTETPAPQEDVSADLEAEADVAPEESEEVGVPEAAEEPDSPVEEAAPEPEAAASNPAYFTGGNVCDIYGLSEAQYAIAIDWINLKIHNPSPASTGYWSTTLSYEEAIYIREQIWACGFGDYLPSKRVSDVYDDTGNVIGAGNIITIDTASRPQYNTDTDFGALNQRIYNIVWSSGFYDGMDRSEAVRGLADTVAGFISYNSSVYGYAITLVNGGAGSCGGYSYIFDRALESIGIGAHVINGDGPYGYHSWVYVPEFGYFDLTMYDETGDSSYLFSPGLWGGYSISEFF